MFVVSIFYAYQYIVRVLPNIIMHDIMNKFQIHNIGLLKTGSSYIIPKKLRFGLSNKAKFFNFIMPPFIAICSLILFSSTFIYFYNPADNKEKNELIN